VLIGHRMLGMVWRVPRVHVCDCPVRRNESKKKTRRQAELAAGKFSHEWRERSSVLLPRVHLRGTLKTGNRAFALETRVKYRGG
jgi:hypothetical protein